MRERRNLQKKNSPTEQPDRHIVSDARNMGEPVNFILGRWSSTTLRQIAQTL
jgi:hypothetical protein